MTYRVAQFKNHKGESYLAIQNVNNVTVQLGKTLFIGSWKEANEFYDNQK